jgi:Protein of unknown function (DUF4435)
MILKYDLFDIVSVAIMNNEPIVIVEGKDDYQIYQTIADDVNPNIKVYQVNEFEDYEEGCTGVIKCIERLQSKFEERVDNIHKILGVIDRDVRPFRNEMPELRGLFATKHYSIETYFATQENLQKLISKITYSPIQEITDDLLTFVQVDFLNSIDILFLLSLEALKNACEIDYDKQVGYDDAVGKITDRSFLNSVFPFIDAKKEDLYRFGAAFGISIREIKLIAKGKWYLYWFLHQTYPKIRELKESCRNSLFPQCRSCRVGNYNNCLLKMKQEKYRLDMLYDDILMFVDKFECADIIDAFQRLN